MNIWKANLSQTRWRCVLGIASVIAICAASAYSCTTNSKTWADYWIKVQSDCVTKGGSFIPLHRNSDGGGDGVCVNRDRVEIQRPER
jgi:hypothetical protein